MSTYFKNGGKININQLEHLGNSILETDAKNKTLLYIPGVLKLPDTISRNFKIEVTSYDTDNSTGTISVGYIATGSANAPFGGVAIDKFGKTISITKNQAFVTNTKFTNNAWTPSRADDPELTDFGPINDDGYQRNSGNYNIPITVGSNNYVYIKYLEVVKQNASSTQVASGVNYETEFTDGYCIVVTTTQSVDDDLILIGTVSSTGTATNSVMQLGYLNGSTVGAEYHAQTGWSNYPTLAGEYIDLETHVNALGTGIPSATNPHGLSAADIGANVNNAGFTTISTMTALNTSTYTIADPILDLTVEGAAEAYDVVLLDASNAPENSTVTVRLPEANINTTAYKYTFRNVGQSTGTTVILSSEITNTQSNQIDGGSTIVESDTTFSYLTLNTTEAITVVVGLTNDGYNWWRI